MAERHQGYLLELRTISPLDHPHKISFLQGQIATLEELMSESYYLDMEKKQHG